MKSQLDSNIKSKKKAQPKDLTIKENDTAEQLDKLAKEYKKSLNVNDTKKCQTNKDNLTNAFSTGAKSVATTKKSADTATASATTTSGELNNKKKPPSSGLKIGGQPKQLATLTERRQDLKRQLKQSSEPTAQDWEIFKVRALQTSKEYSEFVKNSRPCVNMVVVGHVDAGKSTLVGHLLYKLGQISGKQMHRYEVDSQRSGKASFKFAWALDETNEERARGVTIDIALTRFETPQKDVILLDAPGHVDFIPAVISGAAQADAAILVVDATRGEFETGFSIGGQTREHMFLVRSLGVKSLIVCVNKMDNVDWNHDRYNDIVEQLRPFLKQVGFGLKDDVQFVAVSGMTGDNLIERRSSVATSKKKQSSHPQLMDDKDVMSHVKDMPSLVEAIDRLRPTERMVDKPTRVCITDVFKGMSSGVFLGAKLVSGKLESKQKLILLPPNEQCEIKQVENRDNNRMNKAFAGDIVTTVATGVDINKYYRGCMLCDPLIPCHVTNRFQARIIMFQNCDIILLKGTPIEIHINGTFECGEVRKLISLLNKNTGELIQNRPRCVAKNSSAIIQLKLSRVVCCELYEDNKDLGRFMMRSYGKTIAAGLITKIKSAKVPKSGKSKMKSK